MKKPTRELEFIERIVWFTESLKVSKKEIMLTILSGFVCGLSLFLGLTVNSFFIILAFTILCIGFVGGVCLNYRETKNRVRKRMEKFP